MLEDVHVGEDGWLFLKGGSNQVIRYYTEPDFFSDDFLKGWLERLRERTKFFSRNNIGYVHIVAPEKISVYERHFGYALPFSEHAPLRRLAQAVAAQPDPLPFIDLIPLLTPSAGQHDTYFKTDTHWNLRGARKAFEAVCSHLGYAIDDDFGKRELAGWPVIFDLGGKLSPPVYENHVWIPFNPNVVRGFANKIVLLQEAAEKTGAPSPLHHGSHAVFTNDRARYDEIVVIFGDSYSDFRPGTFTALFTEHFRETHFIWSNNIDFQYCTDVKATIVISEVAERFMREVPEDRLDVERYTKERLLRFEAEQAKLSIDAPIVLTSKNESSGFRIKSRVAMNDATNRSLIYAQGVRPNRPQPIPVYDGQDMGPLIRGMDRNKPNPQFDFDHFPDVTLYMRELKDAYFIIENGLDNVICTSTGDLVAESTWFMSHPTEPDGSLLLQTPMSTTEFDDVFLGFDAAWHNYYHFLALGVNRSFLARPFLDASCKIIVPDYASRSAYSQMSYSEDSYSQALALSGLSDRVSKLPVGIYKAKRIRFLWPDNLDPTLLAYMDIFRDVFTRIKSGLTRNNALPTRIFLSRERGSNPRLSKSEIAMFDQFVEQFNYTKVYFEDHDLVTQAQLLMNAGSIIAPHGAGLGNIMFGDERLRVNELTRDLDGQGFLRSCFYQAASLNRQPYAFLNHSAGDYQPEIVDRFFEISLRRPS